MGQTQGKGRDARDDKVGKSKTMRQKSGGDIFRSRENLSDEAKDVPGYFLITAIVFNFACVCVWNSSVVNVTT